MDLVRTSQRTSSDSKNFQGYRYDVFLSFRGEDTRKTFTDHLYTALNNAGFSTFRDDDELERGEDIKAGLQEAIQLSRTSVVVFSKDYASSRWCLDELVMILERKRPPSDHVVLPVFYNVDPSHVRKQTGSIGEAFDRHQKTRSPKNVKEWRKALAEVADLAGMVLQNQADGYESKFIEKIVKVIGDKLNRMPLSVELKLIGIQSQVQRIKSWLQDESSDVGIFVVYGMSGIGKTTTAKLVYNSNYKRFKGSSFIENIKETADQPNGLVQIQMQLLSDILNGREVKIHSVSEGISKIEGAISSRKAPGSFIVSLLPDHKIRGLNIFATYAKEENFNNGSTDSDSDDDNDLCPIMIKVSNKSKGLKWIYGPDLYGIPGEGEDMTWLSHWKMENETILKCGDQVHVSVPMRPGEFQLKEFGVELVQEHQDKMSTQHNTTADLPHYPFVIGGDLSMWEYIPGEHLVGFPKENNEYVVLNYLIMDSDEDDTGNEVDRQDEDTDTEEEQQDDRAIVATRAAGSNNFAGVYSSDNEEEKRDEDTDIKEEQQDDQTLVGTRAAGSDNCGIRRWKVLIMAAVLLVLLFFMWSLCSHLAKESREKFMEFTDPT